MPQTAEILDRIEALLGSTDSRELIEHALTDGYARVLSLETRRLRLQRELLALDEELSGLRRKLAALRDA